MIAYLPLSKAKRAKGEEKPDLSNRSLPPSKSTVPDFSKPDKSKTKDKNYKPAVFRASSQPPQEGSLVEFHHPKHSMKTRGRITAVGQDGYTARVASGEAVQVPHSHHIAELPIPDHGQEPNVSPADARASFLGPTEENGLQATPMQLAVLDVLAQYGLPLGEEDFHKITYDQARRVITKYIMDDRSSSQMPDADEDEDAQESTGEATGDDQEDTGDDEDEDGPEATPMPPQGSQEPQEGQQPSQASPSPPGAAGGSQQPSQAPTEPTDGTDVSQDGSGPQYQLDQDPAVMEDPEVAEAVKNLIAALQVSSTAPGTPDQEDISGPDQAKKHPAVKKKIGVLVNTSKNKK